MILCLSQKSADVYFYTLCSLILQHQIMPLSRELLHYFRLLSHRLINVGHIQMHTLWSKTRVEHLPSDTHTKDLFLFQLNDVPNPMVSFRGSRFTDRM